MKNEGLFFRLLQWKDKHIKEQNFVLFVSLLVGILTAIAAITLKSLIHIIEDLLTGHFHMFGANYLLLLYPVIGILLSGLFVKYIVREDIGHGVTKILYAFSKRQSRIKPHNMYSSILASSVTIGFGGSVGAESPIVLTGAAIGSNLGRLFRLEQKTLMLLVGCGAAGAVAGIFKAPIAGFVFVIEVLLIDLTMTSMLPLLISSVTAATLSYLLTGTQAMFSFSQTEIFGLQRIPYVLLLGIFCGLLSLYFTSAMNWIEGKFRKLQVYWKKFLLGASILSILIFLLPPLYGEGYNTIENLLNNDIGGMIDQSLFSRFSDNPFGIIGFFAVILLTKVFASSATNGGGGCGGIFAPSLFVGCIAGFLFAYIMNLLPNETAFSGKNFALLGMAGAMSGIMHAPLTGVFLIAELTGGYDLFLPLMITSISSYATIKSFQPHSIYSMRLAQKGELLTHHKDQAVLTLLKLDNVIEKDFLTVSPETELSDMVKVISQSSRNLFPVVDEAGRLLGVVQLDNIRNIMFRPDLYHKLKVSTFMVSPPAKININMPMETIMHLFDDSKAWNLPVIDDDGVYIGFVSKSKIFNSYRKVLVDFSEV